MALLRQSGFQGGEIAPGLQARPDIEARKVGARTLRNFVPLPTGPAQNRAGFQFCGETKVAGLNSRLVPFTFSTSQAYVLEFGHQYVRVWQGGARVLNDGGTQVELVTPYSYGELADLSWTQSGDTLTVFSPSHPAQEIVRHSQSSWTIAAYSVATGLAAPTGLAFADPQPTTINDTTHAVKRWDWVVTVIRNGVESPPSAALTSTCLLATDRPVFLSCSTWSGADQYCWYRGRYGSYGYVGNSRLPLFMDEGQSPNFGDTPPLSKDPFANGQNPSVGCYFQQRFFAANQPAYPQRVVGSRVGRYHNHDYSTPQKDDDAVDFEVASSQYEEVRALVPMRHLLVLTANSEFAVDNGDSPITPTSFNLRVVSGNGCAPIKPIVAGDACLYVQAQHGQVRELLFDVARGTTGGWTGTDISLLANHLLASAGRGIVAWAFQKLPQPIVWAVRDDGKLLSCTYHRDAKVVAWAQHDTLGTFESLCAVPEGNEDGLYAIVKRTINGSVARYIERMATRQVFDSTIGCFLDASVWHSGTATTGPFSIPHLAGETVRILADGVVRTGQVGTNGDITLPVAAEEVFIGLPYTSDIELLDVAVEDQDIRPDEKLVSRVTWDVEATAGIQAGESFADLQPWRPELGDSEPSTGLYTMQLPVPIASSWNRTGRAVLRQSNPLPVTVLAVSREVEIGGSR